MRLTSRNPEPGTQHVCCIDDGAGVWIVLLDVYSVDRELLIPVKDLNESFGLFLRIADQHWTGFDLIGLRRREHQKKRQGEASGVFHDNLLSFLAVATSLMVIAFRLSASTSDSYSG